MPSNPTAKLSFKKATDKDRDLTWDSPELCQGPEALLSYLVKHMFVDVGEFADLAAVVVSSGSPTTSDTGKIWGKTSSPPGVGVHSGGSWQVVYKYPSNIPFLWDSTNGTPTYFSTMSSSAMAGAGLTAPPDSKWKWVIFNPASY